LALKPKTKNTPSKKKKSRKKKKKKPKNKKKKKRPIIVPDERFPMVLTVRKIELWFGRKS